MNKAGSEMRGGVQTDTPSGGSIERKKVRVLRKEGREVSRKKDKDNKYRIMQPAVEFQQAYVNLPLSYLSLFSGLTGTTIVIALLLHRQADLRAWPVVRLPTALFAACGLNRKAVSRALQQLERRELVRVHRKPGHRSTVTVLWHPIRDLCFVTEEDEEDEL